jgi:hypothetical protein
MLFLWLGCGTPPLGPFLIARRPPPKDTRGNGQNLSAPASAFSTRALCVRVCRVKLAVRLAPRGLLPIAGSLQRPCPPALPPPPSLHHPHSPRSLRRSQRRSRQPSSGWTQATQCQVREARRVTVNSVEQHKIMGVRPGTLLRRPPWPSSPPFRPFCSAARP